MTQARPYSVTTVVIPEFNAPGDLPPGVYEVSIQEALVRFAQTTPQRQAVGMRLKRIYRIAKASSHLKRFIVFGSFVTARREPNDVDIFLIMDDEFDVTKVEPSAAILFDHPSAQSLLGASVFWVRSMAALGGELDAIEDWMLTRIFFSPPRRSQAGDSGNHRMKHDRERHRTGGYVKSY